MTNDCKQNNATCGVTTHARKYPIIVNVLQSLMTSEIVHELDAVFETLPANSWGVFLWNNHKALLVCFDWIFVLLNRPIFRLFSNVRAYIKSIIPYIMKFHSDYYIVYAGWTHSWWRHEMATFSLWLALCARNSPVTGEFPAQRLVTRSFDVFFDLGLDKGLSKQT